MNFASPLTDDEVQSILIVSGVSRRKRRRSLSHLTSLYASQIVKTAEGHLKKWCECGVLTEIWDKLSNDQSTLIGRFNLHSAATVSDNANPSFSGLGNHHRFEVSLVQL